MRRYHFLLAALLYSTVLLSQPDSSPYAGTLRSFSTWYAVNAPDSIYTLFNNDVKAKVSMDTWRKAFPNIKGSVGTLGSFTLDATGQGYVNYVAFGANGPLGLMLSLDSTYHIQGIFPKQNPARSSYHTNYRVHLPDGVLSGELMAPERRKGYKPPVVLIIAGSGPTDRNGNSILGLHTDCYQQLAQELNSQGIASLRYDKRWIGESMNFKGSLDSLRFEDYVGDARACIRQLRTDTNFSSVYVIGHSEGALIGAIVSHEEKVDGFVSLAGAGFPAESVLRKQLTQSGLDQAGVEKNLDSLKKGKELYISSWNNYDPAREISKLKVPVMIIQGLRDLQVDRADAEKLAAAAPKAWVVYMDSMNHVLKGVPADKRANLSTYNHPQLQLYPDLVPAIVSFIRSRKKE
ncbi:MAG: alpha/beta hydrolase [Sphingobacteriales bacterium]|nr:alpha/beta hydrolase [Sphingobacteriales bacterium]